MLTAVRRAEIASLFIGWSEDDQTTTFESAAAGRGIPLEDIREWTEQTLKRLREDMRRPYDQGNADPEHSQDQQ